jgi:hypothetical protein
MATTKLQFTKLKTGEFVIKTPPDALKTFLGKKKQLYLTESKDALVLSLSEKVESTPTAETIYLPSLSVKLDEFLPQD